ncbi:MAG TPA: fumarylacetoacetate hydrolase family protein [Candidatus Elarobacter sp.]|jgi:2-keto-4-pentenoate hydratase/2-oxohepta-3-ene-1,7-dioic acid hydratase in catechol pathway|nr:fumarylacetoacetate hydrolase family protein [Candidatus Elarobacter sp.]
MRLVMFEERGEERLGVCEGDRAVDLAWLGGALPRDVMEFVRGGEAARAAVVEALRGAPDGAWRPLRDLRLLPPIARPGKIVCLGLNYVDHAAEGGHAKPDYPSIFLRSATSLVAHEQPILLPRCSDKLDYEAELVAVVGTTARHVAKADALRYVAGYSCFDDASIRDYQHFTAQWTIGKNFDRTGAFGPWFVTADELPPGAAGLTIESRLNGQVMQHANTRDMIFPVDETIALLTECMTLEPGDLLVMGTPGGVGHTRKPPVFMRDGDLIEVEIESIGVLRNRVAAEV